MDLSRTGQADRVRLLATSTNISARLSSCHCHGGQVAKYNSPILTTVSVNVGCYSRD